MITTAGIENEDAAIPDVGVCPTNGLLDATTVTPVTTLFAVVQSSEM
jgi:hypothetical protein